MAYVTGVYTALPLTRKLPAGPVMGPKAIFVGFFRMIFSGLWAAEKSSKRSVDGKDGTGLYPRLFANGAVR